VASAAKSTPLPPPSAETIACVAEVVVMLARTVAGGAG
jgi:hypothetical protein